MAHTKRKANYQGLVKRLNLMMSPELERLLEDVRETLDNRNVSEWVRGTLERAAKKHLQDA